MLPKHTLLANILFASVAVVVHCSPLESHLARRRTNGLSGPVKRVEKLASDSASDVTYNSASGALWEEPGGTFTYVAGVLTAPSLSGNGDSAALAWVGIDGVSCTNVLLSTGIEFGTDTNGNPFYIPWYQWYPDDFHYLPGLDISPGDSILASVASFSPTTGQVSLQNLNIPGQTVSVYLTSSNSLCQQDAEWIVSLDGDIPLVDFGAVTFTDAVAYGSGGIYTPSGASIVSIENNGVTTSVSTSGDAVTIQYD